MKDILFWFLVAFSIISLPADIFFIVQMFRKKKKTPEIKQEEDKNIKEAIDYVINNSKKIKQLDNLNRNIVPANINEINNFDYEFTNEYAYNHFDYEKAFKEISAENYNWFYGIQQEVVSNQRNEVIYLQNFEDLKRMPSSFNDETLKEIEDEIINENDVTFITRAYVYINKKLLDKDENVLKQEHKVFDMDNAINYCIKNMI